jgi:hypothetical protein
MHLAADLIVAGHDEAEADTTRTNDGRCHSSRARVLGDRANGGAKPGLTPEVALLAASSFIFRGVSEMTIFELLLVEG